MSTQLSSIACFQQNNNQGVVHPQAGKIHSAQTIAWADLSAVDYQNWMKLCDNNAAALDSPYFHPEFTKCVAAVRDDVEIAVFKDEHSSVCGYLPFQRLADGTGQLIGGRMNDFGGMISTSSAFPNPNWLLKELNLKRFDFHAIVSTDSSLEPFVFENMPSHYVDLRGSYEDYLRFIRCRSSTLKRLPQKSRALRRNVGDLSFEFCSADPSDLEQLIELKRRRFQRTNTFDILSVQWAANLLRTVHQTDRNGFQGMLSVLRAGDQFVGAQMGMICGDVLHYWFPVYDLKFAKYSPGLQLMQQTCRAAHRRGIKRIDMSYGESDFKDKFCNGSSTVSYGSVIPNPVTRFFARQRYFTRLKLKQVPKKSAARVVFRKFFPNYGSWHFK